MCLTLNVTLFLPLRALTQLLKHQKYKTRDDDSVKMFLLYPDTRYVMLKGNWLRRFFSNIIKCLAQNRSEANLSPPSIRESDLTCTRKFHRHSDILTLQLISLKVTSLKADRAILESIGTHCPLPCFPPLSHTSFYPSPSPRALILFKATENGIKGNTASKEILSNLRFDTGYFLNTAYI